MRGQEIDRATHTVGHVHDLRARLRDGELEVVELLVGRRGALARLGIPVKGVTAAHPLAWSDVVGLEPGRIVVRATPPELEP